MARIQPRQFNLYAKGGKASSENKGITEYQDRLKYQKACRIEALNHLQDMINMYFDMLRKQEDMVDTGLPKGKMNDVYDDIDDVIMIEI